MVFNLAKKPEIQKDLDFRLFFGLHIAAHYSIESIQIV